MRVKTPIEHILWDWNGTLLDDVAACIAAVNVMLRRRGLAPTHREHYLEIFGFPVKHYYRKLGFDLEQEDWDGLAREYHELYAGYAAEAPLRPGISEVLAAFRRQSLPMSVLSASEQGILESMLGVRGLRALFSHVRGLSDLYAHSKIAIGQALIDKLGAPPKSLLLIGDTVHDSEVADALGCECVLLAGGHQADHRLKRCGREVVPDPRELGRLAGRISGEMRKTRAKDEGQHAKP